MILLVTDTKSEHADYIEKELKSLSGNYFRINTNLALDTTRFKYLRNNEQTDLYLFYNGSKVNLKDVSTVWWFNYEPPHTSDLAENEFLKKWIENETETHIKSIITSLNAVFFNHPLEMNFANNKLIQFDYATACGLKTPNTLITSEKRDVIDFYNENQRIIFKTLSHPTLESEKDDYLVYTSLVEYSDIINSNDFSYCSNFFQEYIVKKTEVRVTIIKDKVFAVEIHSQESKKANVDWRRYDLENTPHNIISLPEPIEEACVKITRKMNLNYSTIDLIIDNNNEYWFLELNSNGLWLWLEILTGIPISRNIAKELIKSDLMNNQNNSKVHPCTLEK